MSIGLLGEPEEGHHNGRGATDSLATEEAMKLFAEEILPELGSW